LHAKRILNSNAVLVVDDTGAASIVLGKAIGYGLRPGDPIDTGRITETFLPDALTPIDQLAAFLADTPIQVIRVAREIVDLARESINLRTTQAVLLPVADHIASAIDRATAGIAFEYPLRWEVNQLYPREVAVGHAGVEIVRRRLGVELPAEEAVPLAMHIVNAQFASRGLDGTINMTRRITDALTAVESILGVRIDPNAMSTARFVTHLRYLFVRMKNHQVIQTAPKAVLDAVVTSHPDAYRCAQSIRGALEGDDETLTEDEILYLTLHVARLAQDVKALNS
jgi:beta-glucoside operon transcriptional antiterminator